MFCLILRENKVMITLDMQHLKILVEEEVDFLISIFQITFQIFLKTFLEKDLEEDVEEEENQIIEVLT